MEEKPLNEIPPGEEIREVEINQPGVSDTDKVRSIQAQKMELIRDETGKPSGMRIVMSKSEALLFALERLRMGLGTQGGEDKLRTMETITKMLDFLQANLISLDYKYVETETGATFDFDYKYGVPDGMTEEEANSVMDEIFDSQIIGFVVAGMEGKQAELFDKMKRAQEENLRKAEELKIKEEEIKKKERDLQKQAGRYTSLGMHAAKNLFNIPKQRQLTLFSEELIDEYATATGLSLKNKPDGYGAILNQSQQRVFEGILKAFSDTKYEGHVQTKTIESLKDVYKTGSQGARRKIDTAYQNIDSIPAIKLTQADILRLAGYERRQEDKNDVIGALSFLGEKQFCFYWMRLRYNDKGQPIKNKRGDYEKEEVMEVGTFFRIKTIKEEGSTNIAYYEIQPSAVMLDQVNTKYGGNYFLLIPSDWRDEVKQLTGKRASSYTYAFLLWLRVQFEEIRRGNVKSKRKKPFRVSRSWEEIAIALKMPDSMYRRNKHRAYKILQDAYRAAIKMGYLHKVENDGAREVLYLNEAYYPQPGKLAEGATSA